MSDNLVHWSHRREEPLPRKNRRRKISTTVAPETAAFLTSLIQRGRAASLAEAVDRAVAIASRADAREKLAKATEAYYASLSEEDMKAENELGMAMAAASALVDYDGE
jgi:hypothetical protein